MRSILIALVAALTLSGCATRGRVSPIGEASRTINRTRRDAERLAYEGSRTVRSIKEVRAAIDPSDVVVCIYDEASPYDLYVSIPGITDESVRVPPDLGLKIVIHQGILSPNRLEYGLHVWAYGEAEGQYRQAAQASTEVRVTRNNRARNTELGCTVTHIVTAYVSTYSERLRIRTRR